MRLTNNNLALIILLFVFFSISANIFVWFYATGSFPTGMANVGRVSLCIDIPPRLQNITKITAESGTLFTYQLSAIDSSNPIYFYANASSLASFAMNTSGFISFTPSQSEIGNYTITVWVTHDVCEHSINWSTFTLEIRRLNRFPYWVNLTETNFTGTENQLFTLNLSLNATDPDNDTITFATNETLSTFTGFSITSSGFISFTPADADVCFHVVNITISDGYSGLNSSVFNFTINNVNDPPVLNSTPDQQLCEDWYYFYHINATDDDILHVQCNTQHLHFYDNTSLFVIGEHTGDISLTPSASEVGFQIVRIYATDGELVDYQNVGFTVIEVNDKPVLQSIGSKTIRVNESLYINADANDEEDGSDPATNLTFNVTFLTGTKFFDIDPLTGVVNVTTNDSSNGTYLVRICVNDTRLSNPHVNATSVCGDGNSKSDCEDVSITVTSANRAPNITSYLPLTNMTINETEQINFSVTADDPDGGLLTFYWYKGGIQVAYNYSIYNFSNYTFSTSLGDAGKYNITINVSDGALNATLTWVITVVQQVTPTPVTPSGGGGGGGGACEEIWKCTDWSFCQNTTATQSQLMLQNLLIKIIDDCKKQNISGNCGFQMRKCEQVSNCRMTYKRPAELQACIFTLFPSCYDGIRNCHEGKCEILADCGGPCEECPTCSDGIKNQGEDWIDCGGPCPPCKFEYPKPPKCGDKRCEFAELFSCKIDCGFFWFIVMLSIILLVIIFSLSRREMRATRLRLLKTEKAKREKYTGSLVGMIRKATADKNIKLAKQLYAQIKKAYEQLPKEEKKGIYAKLIKLYAEIEKLEQEREE